MMTDFKIKDKSLADNGERLIDWASRHMPVLVKIKKRFEEQKPLAGSVVGVCLHVTKETAVLVRTLIAGGAKVVVCGSNPLSTQDSVAAALAKSEVNTYAWRGESTEEYYWCINKTIDHRPTITLDDGADLVTTIHTSRRELLGEVKGGTEETTTGVLRLRTMERKNHLKYPIIAVNDALTKYLFDNRYGTGQSTIDGILRATNILLAGKTFVVCGYGWCGRGISMRARGMGANVVVTEVNPLRALEAVMDGFQVLPLIKACKTGDIFVTATGNYRVIRKEHLKEMKNGAIIANAGHFNVEIDVSNLQEISSSKRIIRPNLVEYAVQERKRIYLLAEGRLVNLTAAEGHPSEVMDMSFSNQALCVEYIVKKQKMQPRVYKVPKEIDEFVAYLKLEGIGITIDQITDEQRRYISNWEEGTI